MNLIKNERSPQLKNRLDLDIDREFPIKRIHMESVDSTNNWAKKHIEKCKTKEMLLVTASQQTHGRGRFDRSWFSPLNCNIYATFCFWMSLSQKNVGQISQILALAAIQILEQRGFLVRFKWPNDLVLSGKKVGGILCETVTNENARGAICGIGLNVNMEDAQLKSLSFSPTSLLIESKQLVNLDLLLDEIQLRFRYFIYQWFQDGFEVFFQRLQKVMLHASGEPCQFHDGRDLHHVHFQALLPDGSVQVLMKDGRSKVFYSGEF